MDSSFASTIDQWRDFYVMAGTASATLVGLLFVSVSLHADLITDPAAVGVLASARRAFGNFITVLLIALIFVIPGQSAYGLGIPLVIFGGFHLVRAANAARILHREHARVVDLLGAASDLGRLSTGILSSLGLLAIALTLFFGSTTYLNWLVGVIGVILVGGAESSWSLLLDLAMAKRRLGNHRPAAEAPAVPAVPGEAR